MKKYFQSTLVTLCLCCQQHATAEPVTLFSIGSGDISGNYYPVAQSLCEAFNRFDDSRRRCSPEPSTGSIYNLKALRDGALEFAIVQSDWQSAAFGGTGPFEGLPPMNDLRVVTALFSETVTILVSRESEVSSAVDLLGKTVDIGRPASGRNATVKHLMDALDFSLNDFGDLKELRPAAAIDELCEGTIDATILVVGHPSALVTDAIQRCGARIVSFDGPVIRELLDQGATYQRAFIDLSLYGTPNKKVPSLSVVATLVTRTIVDDELVEDFLSAIESAAPQLSDDLPVLRDLPETLGLRTPLGVPFHEVGETSR